MLKPSVYNLLKSKLDCAKVNFKFLKKKNQIAMSPTKRKINFEKQIQKLNCHLKLQMKRKDLKFTKSLLREQKKEIENLEIQQKIEADEKLANAGNKTFTDQIHDLTTELEETEKFNFDLVHQMEQYQNEINFLKKKMKNVCKENKILQTEVKDLKEMLENSLIETSDDNDDKLLRMKLKPIQKST